MLKRYQKIDLAARQLETALILFLDDQDTVSVITLGFAAETILANHLEATGSDRPNTEAAGHPLTIHPWLDKRAFAGSQEPPTRSPAAGKVKNLDTTSEREIPLDLEQEAIRILDRAVQTYWEVTGELTPRMILFKTMQEES